MAIWKAHSKRGAIHSNTSKIMIWYALAEGVRLVPIGALMIEHRLIEQVVGLLKETVDKKEEHLDPSLIDKVVDFFRTYADTCHHGKEEKILFRDLARKQLSPEHKRMMDELIEEHVYGRKTVSALADAKERYVRGNTQAMDEIEISLKRLIELYPRHIEKEDKHFFYPSMEYFSRHELDDMLEEFWEFDRKMIHEKYRQVVENMKITYS